MPKQKIRASRRTPMHYSPFSNIVQGKARKDMYYNQTYKSTFRTFHGTVVTPENRNDLLKANVEAYINDNSGKKRYKKIKDKVVRANQLAYDAEKFARMIVNKEKKHYRAWLAGKRVYRYQGMTFDVLTDQIVYDDKNLKQIHNVESEEE